MSKPEEEAVQPAARHAPGPVGEDRPGDPACWLKLVCPACGSMMAAEPPTTCPECHAEVPAE